MCQNSVEILVTRSKHLLQRTWYVSPHFARACQLGFASISPLRLTHSTTLCMITFLQVKALTQLSSDLVLQIHGFEFNLKVHVMFGVKNQLS